jgi:NAD(P)-dependent dehydrogenase (short-subunit alcohol dehydrogenase family)
VDVTNAVAVVTGAGAGIGRGIALRLAAAGGRVVVVDVDDAAAEAAVKEAGAAGGTAVAVQADVTAEDDLHAVVAAASEAFGGFDILVNNAGGVEPPFYPEAPYDDWSAVLDLNLRSVMRATQLAIDHMRGRPAGGAVVNVASAAGWGYGPHDAPEYAAAKAGVMRLTAALAPLAVQCGVRVNCICPGWVDTPASRRTRAAMTAEEQAAVPSPMLQPEQIGDLALTLIEDETLAGTVALWPDGQDWRLLPAGEP